LDGGDSWNSRWLSFPQWAMGWPLRGEWKLVGFTKEQMSELPNGHSMDPNELRRLADHLEAQNSFGVMDQSSPKLEENNAGKKLPGRLDDGTRGAGLDGEPGKTASRPPPKKPRSRSTPQPTKRAPRPTPRTPSSRPTSRPTPPPTAGSSAEATVARRGMLWFSRSA
jgi:hypothetical protein